MLKMHSNGAEFVLFPEFFTTQLLSMNNKDGKPLSINELPDFTEQYKALFETLAKENKIHIIAGTHVINRDGRLYNVAHLFYPDGRVEEHKDRKSISSWATEAVTALNQAGIMNGRANGQFDPKATVTRAEVATVIHR